MKISRNWLADYVDFDELSNEEFSEIITTRVAEVDEVHRVASSLDSIRVAKVLEVSAVPDKDKLRKVKLSLGDEQVEVICGASNCREGLYVAYAPVGSTFTLESKSGEPQVITVEKKKVGGVESNGLLLSEKELDIGSDNAGILELNSELLSGLRRGDKKTVQIKEGTSLSSILPLSDFVLEIDNKSLTHRPDLWGHFGFAREIAALLDKPLKKNIDQWALDESMLASLGNGKAIGKIKIEKGCGCRRFLALSFEGVSTIQSPLWMRSRLYAVGAGVKNALVDLSNYVMHDIGQPNHAYDTTRLSSEDFTVRRARSGETLETLDETELKLSDKDIVITNGDVPVALGGIIGGLKSSISDDTTSVVLESANFDPVLVRQTAKRYSLRTDASNRFEKSLSSLAAPTAIFRFAELLKEIFPDSKVSGAISDCHLEVPSKISAPVRFSYIKQRLGADISDDRISQVLSSLGFDTSSLKDGVGNLEVPYYRATRDVSIEEDLLEEVGRIYGYENVPEEAPGILSSASSISNSSKSSDDIADLFRGFGFSEISNYSFISPEKNNSLGISTDNAIEIKNPVDSDNSKMRTSLISGMCSAVELNAKNFNEIALFEFGSTYTQIEKESERDNGALRTSNICFAYASGKKESKSGSVFSPEVNQGESFYSGVSILKRLVSITARKELAIERLSKDIPHWCHPYRAAEVLLAGEKIGVVAEVRPGVLKDVSQKVVISEINLDLLFSHISEQEVYSPISKYPDSFFEMSVVMPLRDEFSSLNNLVQKNVDENLLKKVEVVSVYTGSPLEDNEKSVSVKLYLGAHDRTLSGEELDTIQDSLMKGVEKSSYKLRS